MTKSMQGITSIPMYKEYNNEKYFLGVCIPITKSFFRSE